MNHNFKDLTGNFFGRLIVIRLATKEECSPLKHYRIHWVCECSCNNKNIVICSASNLISGNTKSCGCYEKELLLKRNENTITKYPKKECSTKLYWAWNHMIQRCENDKANKGTRGRDYKKRGIKVCPEWRNDYFVFKEWSLKNGFENRKDISLDRIDNDGNYEPSNCRWTDNITQANNKRTNKFIEINGITKTLMQWARELNLNYDMLRVRVKNGWTGEKLLLPSKNKESKFNGKR